MIRMISQRGESQHLPDTAVVSQEHGHPVDSLQTPSLSSDAQSVKNEEHASNVYIPSLTRP